MYNYLFLKQFWTFSEWMLKYKENIKSIWKARKFKPQTYFYPKTLEFVSDLRCCRSIKFKSQVILRASINHIRVLLRVLIQYWQGCEKPRFFY